MFQEKNLLELNESEMQNIRGAQISMIFQQPQSCLNPVFTIGAQIEEVFQIHGNITKKEAAGKAVELAQSGRYSGCGQKSDRISA